MSPDAQAARVLHRLHRLSRIHAAGEGSRHRRDAADRDREGALGRLGADSATLFYVTEDDAKRVQPRVAPRLGSDEHTLVFEETDARFGVGVDLSRSRGYVFITSHSATTSEVRYVPADRPLEPPTLMVPRRQDHEYYADHHGGRFLHRHQRPRPQFPPGDARRSPTVARRTGRSSSPIARTRCSKASTCSRATTCCTSARGGFPRLVVVRFADGEKHEIEFPEPAYSAFARLQSRVRHRHVPLRLRVVRDARFGLRLRHEFAQPQAAQAGGGARRLRPDALSQRAHLREGARTAPRSRSRWSSARTSAPSGPRRCCCRATAPMAIPEMVTFSSSRLSLLDRGVIFALAHVRGGGEMGKRWHDEGRMMHKKNTFTDFIACAEHVIARKVHGAGPAGDRRRQRRRPADGRGHQPAARPVPRRGLGSAVRRRDQHHARRHAAADHRRVRGVGQSRTSPRPTTT